MRTSELIAALTADPVPEPIRLGRRVALALLVGVAASVALYGLLLGPRPDVAAAAGTMRFWLKFVELGCVRPADASVDAAARPPRRQAKGARALAPCAFPLARSRGGRGIADRAAKRVDVPAHGRDRNALHDHHSDAGRASPRGLIVALRAGAPLHPGLTGAMAGAAAAGVGALVYASSCPGDSPLFVATWYPLATLICMAAGALAGRRFLAW